MPSTKPIISSDKSTTASIEAAVHYDLIADLQPILLLKDQDSRLPGRIFAGHDALTSEPAGTR